jgi:hypothetical protein
MTQIQLDDVLRYVHHVALHPFQDVDEVANIYFDDKAPLLVPKEAVIHDLLNIPKTKRAIIANIVREKTNFDITVMSEEDAKIIIRQGETLEPVMKKEISIITPSDEVQTNIESNMDSEIINR